MVYKSRGAGRAIRLGMLEYKGQSDIEDSDDILLTYKSRGAGRAIRLGMLEYKGQSDIEDSDEESSHSVPPARTCRTTDY